MDWFVDWFLGWFYELLYGLQAGLCSLIDFIKSIFFKLCGLDTVVIDGESQDLVSSLIGSDTIRRVFLTIFLIGVILLVIFVIIALIRVNYTANEKKGWGEVLSKAGHSFFNYVARTVSSSCGNDARQRHYGFYQHRNAAVRYRRADDDWRTNAHYDGGFGLYRQRRSA